MIASTQAQPDVSRVAPIVKGSGGYLSVLLRLIGMDLYKVRRRLLSKALLLIGVAIVVGTMIITGLVGWYTASKPLSDFVPVNCAVRPVESCINHPATQADMQQFRQRQLQHYANSLNVPTVWNLAGQLIITILVVLGIILAGALVGGEYSVGMVRLLFTRGPTRLQFLLAKIVVLAIYVVPAFVLLMLLAPVVGAVMSPLVGIGVDWSFFTAAWLGHFLLFLLLGVLYWFAYMLMALFFGTVGRSTVAGIVGPLVWLSIEPVLTRIIGVLTNGLSGSLADFVKAIPDYFLGNNLTSLFQDQAHALNLAPAASYSNAHALLVVAVYLVVFIGVACWLTVRRDVTH